MYGIESAAVPCVLFTRPERYDAKGLHFLHRGQTDRFPTRRAARPADAIDLVAEEQLLGGPPKSVDIWLDNALAFQAVKSQEPALATRRAHLGLGWQPIPRHGATQRAAR